MINVIKKVLQLRRHPIIKTVLKKAFLLFSKLPPKKNLVIFESFLGKQYSDNPRAIYEYMVENKYPHPMYWSMDRRHEAVFQGRGLKTVPRLSLKWLYLMARAEYWVTNSRLPLWIPKPAHTVYIQTWHGTPLKRLAMDMDEVHMPGTDTERYKQNFTSEASKWDYLVSPNSFSTEVFRRAFLFNKTVLEVGYPRNDFLVNHNTEAVRQEIKRKIGLPEDKKVILYAPTWRDNQFYEKGKYKFDLQLDLKRMKAEFGKDYVILLRLHYLIAENLDLRDVGNFVWDVSNYEDIRDLYVISDLLITDYSSVFFDYSILKRPILFFMYDIAEYRDTIRGFYFDMEEIASEVIVKTNDGLVQKLKEVEQQGFRIDPKLHAFLSNLTELEDGKASERVVAAVFGK